MMHSRNLIYFFNIVLSLLFLNIHFINGSNDNSIKNEEIISTTNNNNNNNQKNKQNENSNKDNVTLDQEEDKNIKNENNNINNVNYISKKKALNEQESCQYPIEENNSDNKNYLGNKKKEIEITKTEVNGNKNINKNNITHPKKINFTITILRNNEILDDIKIDNIVANNEECFMLYFNNCAEEQLKRYINPITSIINEEKEKKIKKQEIENKKKNKEEEVEQEEDEKYHQDQDQDQNQNNQENNNEEEDEKGKKETKNKNKKEINDKDEMETNTQKKDIKYEVLLIRDESNNKNEEEEINENSYNIKEVKNNNNSESLIKYISSIDDRKKDEEYYTFKINNGDKLIIEVYDDEFTENIYKCYTNLNVKFFETFPNVVQKGIKEINSDIYNHINRITNILDFIENATYKFELNSKNAIFLYNRYKMSQEICDLFDKLNNGEYSKYNEFIKKKIKEININYVDKNSTKTFTIDKDIKNFIDSIQILNLPKKICDEEDYTVRREQYKSTNGSLCGDSCKRRIYMNR